MIAAQSRVSIPNGASTATRGMANRFVNGPDEGNGAEMPGEHRRGHQLRP